MHLLCSAFLALILVAQQTPAVPRSSPDGCAPQATTVVWTSITPPVALKRIEPKFQPPQGRIQGTVLMDVWIDEAGEVTCVKVTRSIPIADAAAVAAVRQWKFTPAKLGDRPVAVVHQVGIFYPDGP
jgi:periplasmic protein TonB